MTMKLAQLILSVFLLVVIDGKVLMKGNAPFAELYLSTKDKKDYKITGPLKDELKNQYQGKRVRLKGELEENNKGFFFFLSGGTFNALEVIEVLK